MTMYRFNFTITKPNAETDWPNDFNEDWNGLNYYREFNKIMKSDEIFSRIRHKIVGDDLEKIRIYSYDALNQTKLQAFHDKILDNKTIFNREIVYYENLGFTVEVSDVRIRQDIEIEDADTY